MVKVPEGEEIELETTQKVNMYTIGFKATGPKHKTLVVMMNSITNGEIKNVTKISFFGVMHDRLNFLSM